MHCVTVFVCVMLYVRVHLCVCILVAIFTAYLTVQQQQQSKHVHILITCVHFKNFNLKTSVLIALLHQVPTSPLLKHTMTSLHLTSLSIINKENQ